LLYFKETAAMNEAIVILAIAAPAVLLAAAL